MSLAGTCRAGKPKNCHLCPRETKAKAGASLQVPAPLGVASVLLTQRPRGLGLRGRPHRAAGLQMRNRDSVKGGNPFTVAAGQRLSFRKGSPRWSSGRRDFACTKGDAMRGPCRELLKTKDTKPNTTKRLAAAHLPPRGRGLQIITVASMNSHVTSF